VSRRTAGVAASAGVATRRVGEDLIQTWRRADAAMYVDKHHRKRPTNPTMTSRAAAVDPLRRCDADNKSPRPAISRPCSGLTSAHQRQSGRAFGHRAGPAGPALSSRTAWPCRTWPCSSAAVRPAHRPARRTRRHDRTLTATHRPVICALVAAAAPRRRPVRVRDHWATRCGPARRRARFGSGQSGCAAAGYRVAYLRSGESLAARRGCARRWARSPCRPNRLRNSTGSWPALPYQCGT